MDQDLEKDFEAAMLHLYEELRIHSRTASRLLIEIKKRGGLKTAKNLLHNDKISYGLSEIMAQGRPNLTVEFLVLKPEWSSLFSTEEIKQAKKNLGMP